MENIHKLNQVSPNDIDQLSSTQLVELLNHLLKSEVFKNNLEVKDHYVPTVKITVADGGEDGRIIFNGNTTEYLPNNKCFFQSKASSLTTVECANEIVTTSNELKSQVREVIQGGGCYILFMGYNLGAKIGIENREKKIEEEVNARINAIKSKVENHEIDIDESQIRVYDSNYIAKWANEHISAVKIIDRFRGRLNIRSFLPWDHFLERYDDTIFNVDFYWADQLIEIRNELFSLLKENKCARIVGYSGIGKTRFVGECFRDSNKEDKNIFNSAFCYLDFNNSNEEEVYSFLMNHKSYAGILVIDNCPLDSHNSFTSHVRKFCDYINLITIDNDLENNSNDVIFIDQSTQEDTCSAILAPIKDRFDKSEFEEILSICEGYPFFANAILNHIQEKDIKVVSLELEEKEFKNGIVKKLLSGNEVIDDFQNSDLLAVAKGISIFRRFPFIDDEYEEIDEIDKESFHKKTETVINDVLNTDITIDRFHDIAKNEFKEKRKIIDRRGLNYSIRPEILAVNLAADWLKRFPPTRVDDLITSLEESNLIVEFCERLKSLDQIERSRVLIEKYWGVNRPFVKAEVLNTELGSRLFRSVVEVNPNACVKGLDKTLSTFTIEELKNEFGEGRRNIVWALEKLVFREETFNKSATILAKLALAENESYGNNATGQFLQLFHLYLPGTEANLEKRSSLLVKLLEQEDYHKLILRAIGTGLEYDHFSRAGSANKQGTKVLKDYRPETSDEISNYWEILITLWAKIFDDNSELQKEALNEVETKIRSLVRLKRWEDLEKIVSRAEAMKTDFVWINGIQHLKRLISYKLVEGDDIIEVEKIIKRLEPTNDVARLIDLRVVKPPYEHKKINKGGKNTYEDLAITNLKRFSDYFLEQGENPTDYFDQLLIDRPRLGFQFGKEIGDRLEAKTAIEYLEKGIQYYKDLPENNRSIEFLGGLYTTLSRENKESIIDLTISETLNNEALYLTGLGTPDKNSLKKILQLSKSGSLEVKEFNRFQYGMQLKHLGIETILWLGNRLGEIDKNGYVVGLNILYMHTDFGKDIIPEYKEEVKKWLTSVNIALIESEFSHDSYKWSEVVGLILKEKNEEEFAVQILEQLIEASEDSRHHIFDHYERNVFGLLFQHYFEKVWTKFAEALLNSSGFFQLMLTLQSKNDKDTNEGILFSNIDEKDYPTILAWCKANPEKGAKRMAYIMPCMKKIERDGIVTFEWHPFASLMIDTFGKDEEFMAEVGANLSGVSWVGNIAKYYERVKKLVKQLSDHKLITVQEWAKFKIESLDKQIKLENLRHEEMYGRLD
ncbi:hypothetical protein [Gracilimonas sediminicola]|uniref:Uncharacterized protein n=1 Tax=Gracilimonas sediminicola TaxID=2952158 RepID=A0A9X2RI25_9BACT|nr:hypothetical protein [Gracilimonas sediminicola]MCP9292439.1 hypothetical protein [Gracilimonas sediminicola]